MENARTLCGESRKEATSPMPFLSTKEISKVGTWNVRTMYEASKTAQIAREKRAYNISILGLCETRWTKSGQTRLNTGDTVLYSGHEEENAPHTEGVALMLSHQAYNALIGWEALGPRMMHASFKTRMEKIQGQFRGDGRTVRTLVFGVYKICCITGSYLWVIQKDITL